MPYQSPPEQLTPREAVLMQNEREENQSAREFTLALEDKKLAVARQEAKLSSLLKIPVTIIKLPVLMIMAVGYIVLAARGKEPSDQFWNFMR